MARYKREFDELKYQRYLKEGRGSGTGNHYKPWLRMQDVASIGNSSRLKSAWTHTREVHLFSQLELYWFFMFDWAPDITDIQEQYPLLPLDETRHIAEQLKIKHPTDPKTQHPIVITSDFLLTKRLSNGGAEKLVRTIKYAAAQENKRVQEKFEIEKAYWKHHNIQDWKVNTEQELNRQTVRNIEILRGYVSITDRMELPSAQFADIALYLTESLSSETILLIDATIESDEKFNLRPGSSLTMAYHLIANRYWIVDMEAPITPHHLYKLEAYELKNILSDAKTLS